MTYAEKMKTDVTVDFQLVNGIRIHLYGSLFKA